MKWYRHLLNMIIYIRGEKIRKIEEKKRKKIFKYIKIRKVKLKINIDR